MCMMDSRCVLAWQTSGPGGGTARGAWTLDKTCRCGFPYPRHAAPPSLVGESPIDVLADENTT
jgi:hypothetical protein